MWPKDLGLTAVSGIAVHSAVQRLPELMVLPADMTARQWVAHAGLDPRPYQSGSSVHKRVRISKMGNANIRRILYMPALVAVQRDAHVKAFFDHLVARRKTKLQAYVAVMRKLLYAIHGMLRTQTDFVAEKFYVPASASSVGAATATNCGSPSPSHRYTPSSTRQCRWMFRFAAEPKALRACAPARLNLSNRPVIFTRLRFRMRIVMCRMVPRWIFLYVLI